MNPEKINQKLENSGVPFPNAELSQIGTLETYLLGLTNHGLAIHAKLPEVLTAPAIDAYANWQSDLTQHDRVHRERASFIHFDLKSERFVFPSNPSIGTPNRSKPELGKGKRFVPIVRVHSHPDMSFFSSQDLKRMMASPHSIVDIVAAKGVNYLLLTTDETVLEDAERAEEIMDDTKKSIEGTFGELQEYYRRLLSEGNVPEEVFNELLLKVYLEEYRRYGTEFRLYYTTAATTKIVADAYKLGFYKSDRRGVFTKVPETFLADIFKEWQEEVNSKV